MSKRGLDTNRTAKSRDWEAFWSVAWYNLFNALGVIAVLVTIAGIAWLVFAPSTPTQPDRQRPNSSVQNPQDRRVMQANFNKVLLTTTKACAVKTKGKGPSDVTNCSLFGLRLGMTSREVGEIIDGSGYFSHRSNLLQGMCGTKDCAGTIYQSGEGFTVTVDFGRMWPEDKSLLSARKITLIFGPEGRPYFEPESLRAFFLKAFGAPDTTSDDHLVWGEGGNKGATIHAYAYRSQYWVTLMRIDAAK